MYSFFIFFPPLKFIGPQKAFKKQLGNIQNLNLGFLFILIAW